MKSVLVVDDDRRTHRFAPHDDTRHVLTASIGGAS